MLRFIWTVSFVLTENKIVGSETMVSILSPLEVFRYKRLNLFSYYDMFYHGNDCNGLPVKKWPGIDKYVV